MDERFGGEKGGKRSRTEGGRGGNFDNERVRVVCWKK
jgi:hypothetical protein